MKPAIAAFPLVLLLAACGSGAAEYSNDSSPVGVEEGADSPARPERDKDSPSPKNDAGAPPAGMACGMGRDGVQARVLSDRWPRLIFKLIATPTRVIAKGQEAVESISKKTSDVYSYFLAGTIEDVAVAGDQLYILSDGNVHKGPVTGGELEVAWYGATGGFTMAADATTLYVGALLGDESPLYRGAPTYATDLYGAVPPSTWLVGPSFLALSQTARSLYMLSTFRHEGATVFGVTAIDKATAAISPLFQFDPAGLPEFWSDDTQTILMSKGGIDVIPVGSTDAKGLAKAADPKGLSVTAEYVYFADGGSVRRVRRDGSAPAEAVFEGGCAISTLTVDDEGIYVAMGEGGESRVYALPLP